MELSPARARALLLGAQRLGDAERRALRAEARPVAHVVRAVVGIQAQDMGAASLGVRARLAGSTASKVEGARLEERSITRAWCMRGTLHLVASEDLRWLVGLLGPVGLARGRRRRAELGVNTPEAVTAVREVLAAQGPLTRHEIAAEVERRGVRIADDPQAPAHLVGCAALEGHVCEVAPRGGSPAYALVDDWLGPAGKPLDRDTALAELARRHAAAHPPAAPEDLAAWSGLGLREARRGFEAVAGELEEVRVLGRRAWVPSDAAPAARSVRLLPAFDGLLLGHRDRGLTVRPEHAREVLPGGGILRPTLLVDGRVEGTWRLERGVPAVAPLQRLAAKVQAAVAAEAADVERHRSS